MFQPIRHWCWPALLSASLLGQATLLADEKPSKELPWSQAGSAAALLKLVGSPALPTLLSLIRPDRTLSIRECQVENAAAELDLLSDNQTLVVSGNQLLSHIHVTVNINIHASEAPPRRRPNAKR